MDKLSKSEKIEVILKNDENAMLYNENEISLREIIQAMINGRKIIAVMVITVLLLTMAGSYILTPYSGIAKIMISLNFDGIEKGMDPYGQKFDLGKIKAPVVTSRVIKEMELDRQNITADDLRRNIVITPVVPGEVVQKITNLRESIEKGKENVKTLENYVYYPTDYVISFNIPKDMKISKSQGQEILDGIINSYMEYFYETYGDRAVLANALGKLDYSEYDYPEVSIVMHNQIEIINNYLTAKNGEASDFRSQKTGLAFADIIESVNIVDVVDINRMDSIIGSFKLTKDRARLIKSYEYAIKRFELNRSKKEDESKIASDVMDKFEKDKSIMLMPGSGTAPLTTFETENPNPLYDSLAEKTMTSGIAATNSVHDIEFYRKEIEYYSTEDSISPELKVKAEKEVLTLMDSIKSKLESWINLANETVSEYYETQYYNNAVLKLTPVEVVSANGGLLRTLAIALVVGLMAGVFTALFIGYWKDDVREIAGKTKRVKKLIPN